MVKASYASNKFGVGTIILWIPLLSVIPGVDLAGQAQKDPIGINEGGSDSNCNCKMAGGKGWIAKSLYKTILTKHGPKLLDDFLKALSKGAVAGEKGFAGIKDLKGSGINGYLHELKIVGPSGKYRLLGNVEIWINQKNIREDYYF